MVTRVKSANKTIVASGDDEVRQILHKMGLSEATLYDESPSDNLYEDRLRPDLSEWEIEDAMHKRRFIRGMMLITGDPGSGKGLFANTLAWKIKRYYEGRKALLDYKPRPLFGPYLPFDEEFLKGELSKMAELSKVRISEIPNNIDREDTEKIKDVSKLANEWVRSKRGGIYLSNSVLVLEEFKRYLHNRRPMNPMGITIGHIITWWRHLDILIVGMTPFKREIDRISCLPYVTHEVRCTWQTDGRAKCTIFQTKWVSSKGILVMARGKGTSMPIVIDGWKERPELGGQRYFDLYNSKYLPALVTSGR